MLKKFEEFIMKVLIMILINLLLSFFSVCLAISGGVGQQFDVQGYKIHAFCDEGSGAIEVHGRISGGKRCKNLKIELFLVSDKGRRGHVIAVADDVGGAGSRMFKGRDNVYGINNEWEFTSIHVDCVSGEDIEEADFSESRKLRRSSRQNIDADTFSRDRKSSKYYRKSKKKGATQEEDLKIWEDEEGVIHIEQ
jgi:hypothetical protein